MSDTNRADRAHASLPYEVVELGNGDELALAVDMRGDSTLWIIRPGTCECDRCQGSTVDAAHERLGRLPAEYRERLGLRHRCGRPTSAGHPCRSIVGDAGVPCGWHR